MLQQTTSSFGIRTQQQQRQQGRHSQQQQQLRPDCSFESLISCSRNMFNFMLQLFMCYQALRSFCLSCKCLQAQCLSYFV